MEGPSRSISVHIPVALLSLSLSVFFISQIGAASRSTETMKWQIDNFEKQLIAIKNRQSELTQVIAEREKLVEQSATVQEHYTKLFTDVLDLAKTDADAAKIIEKWKIQRNEAAAAGDKKPEEKK